MGTARSAVCAVGVGAFASTDTDTAAFHAFTPPFHHRRVWVFHAFDVAVASDDTPLFHASSPPLPLPLPLVFHAFAVVLALIDAPLFHASPPGFVVASGPVVSCLTSALFHALLTVPFVGARWSVS
ncbi:TPA: hypothetical protein QDB40_006141 [Burkholderia vietnamiensis]|nr:hypothetical protein [Burkholderia vietnamiensis]